MLAVGSTRSMGERASEYVMSRRLEREAGVAHAEAALRVASRRRLAAELELAAMPKYKKKAAAKGEEADSPLFVKRQAEKLEKSSVAELSRAAKLTPGVTRMAAILHQAPPRPLALTRTVSRTLPPHPPIVLTRIPTRSLTHAGRTLTLTRTQTLTRTARAPSSPRRASSVRARSRPSRSRESNCSWRRAPT